MPILVAGGTGIVGGGTVRRLRERGDAVSVLVRGGDRHPKAAALRKLGASIVDGDLTDPASLTRACEDVDVVICTVTSMPTNAEDGLRRVDREGTLALIDAAAAANVDRFVYASYSGNLREASPLETAKRDCERRLMTGNMNSVILRPSFFMEVWLSPALGFDAVGGAARIYGTGDAGVSYVSAHNVADFAAAAAIRQYPGRHTILEIGGADAISQHEAVSIFERALGNSIQVQHVALDAIAVQRQTDDPLQQSFGALMTAYAKGDVIDGAAAVADHHGVLLRSVEDYARDIATGGAGGPHH
jgi:uncharacterized protein YbjT (DUF2867 family)